MTPRYLAPIRLQTLCRHFCRRSRWFPAVTAILVAALLTWFLSGSPGEPASPPSSEYDAQVVAPPWVLGNPQGRFVLTLYADFECPFCRAYFPVLTQWVDQNSDVVLQWHHLPLRAHEPAASTEARLAECVGEAGGSAAFWRAAQWIYVHTRGDGLGLPTGLRYPDATPAIEQCLASDRPNALIRAQAQAATKGGVAATPSLRMQDRQTHHAILLQGPVEGDALISAMDMLAVGDPVAASSSASTEMPVELVGDMPR